MKIKKIRKIKANKILILGLSYKANVADSRNSLAIKIYLDLKKIYKRICLDMIQLLIKKSK